MPQTVFDDVQLRPAGDAVAFGDSLTPPRVKFPFLDGLRGLAALYVVIHHEAQIYMGEKVDPQPRYFGLYPYMIQGNYAVVIAIVLSGFALMLSVIRSENGTVRGGLGAYLWRRICRLVPAYYAALGVSFLLVACVPAMRRHDGELWGFAFGSADWHSFFDLKNLAAHLLLLHAFSANWIMRIDPPMWSVGVEWVNIFLMPFIQIPVWRRGGGVVLAVFASFLCFAPFATKPFFHDRFTMQWAQPWLVAQFAFGMAAAALVFPKHTPKHFLRLDRMALRIAQHPITLLLLLAMVYWVGFFKRVPLTFLCGAITVCLILHGMTGTWLGRKLVRLFESRFCLWLGVISYSLYLLHTLIQMLLQRAMEAYHLAPAVRLAALLIVATPLCLFGGLLGYKLFEKPFIRGAKE